MGDVLITCVFTTFLPVLMHSFHSHTILVINEMVCLLVYINILARSPVFNEGRRQFRTSDQTSTANVVEKKSLKD